MVVDNTPKIESLYGLTFPLLGLQNPTTMTGEASNFANRTLWTGDNLHILRGMNSECVDLIYLDPPFNSNRNYAAPVGSKAAGAAFEDTWTLDKLDVAWLGLIADEQPALAHVIKTAGVVHGKGMQSYLTMMAVRLLEMRRVLKDTGSIYLHCDPTASHYLKALMDAVFGASNFRNEIVWQRAATKKGGLTRTLANDADYILWYAKSDKAQLRVEGITSPYDMGNLDEKTAKKYSSRDSQGKRFQLTSIVAPGDSEGESGQPIKFGDDVLPPPAGQHWRVPGGRQPGESMQDGFKRLWDEGRLRQAQPGRLPRYVRYLDEQPGRRLNNIWVDIPNLNSMAKERTGYPTQKPLPLLERIINASSNPGDVVLDPFCGCATACVAAELLNRQWVGIDISPRAVDLVKQRLQQAPPLGIGDLFYKMLVIPRTDIPQRTDIDAPKNYRQNKHVLFGQQEGVCAGCRMDFQYKIFEVDHRISKRRGGTDHIENLQLLCPNCNRIKGDRPMEYLVSQLRS